jgi:hypothetical protein
MLFVKMFLAQSLTPTLTVFQILYINIDCLAFSDKARKQKEHTSQNMNSKEIREAYAVWETTACQRRVKISGGE